MSMLPWLSSASQISLSNLHTVPAAAAHAVTRAVETPELPQEIAGLAALSHTASSSRELLTAAEAVLRRLRSMN